MKGTRDKLIDACSDPARFNYVLGRLAGYARQNRDDAAELLIKWIAHSVVDDSVITGHLRRKLTEGR